MSTNSEHTLKIRNRRYRRLSSAEKQEIRELIRKGFSLENIALKLNLRKSTVYYHARTYCKKQTKLNMNALSAKEQGYILGMFVGDGNVIMKTSKGQYGLKFTLDNKRDQKIAHFLRILFKKAGKKTETRTEARSLYIRIFSKKLTGFISNLVSTTKRPDSQRNIKSLVNYENWSSDFKIGFVSGLLDSDGYVHYGKKGKHYGAVIKTNNPSLAKQIQGIFSDLKVMAEIRAHEFQGTYPTDNLCYDIYIPSKEMWKFCHTLLSIKHSEHHQ